MRVLAALCGALLWHGAVAGVPVVGCPADGMGGPVGAPTAVTAPPLEAEGLAWYAAEDGFGVLAPQGWHCAEVYGSSGAELFVTPEQHAPDAFFRTETRLHGPAVVLSVTNGSTSGRFEVARLIPRLFPAYRGWAIGTRSEEAPGALELRPDVTPYVDRVRRSATRVAFRVAAGGAGRGVAWRLAPNGQGLVGAAVLLPQPDMDVLMVLVRLPPDLARLAPTIVRTFEAGAGER